jgi:DNA-binding response OmpR family regulator
VNGAADQAALRAAFEHFFGLTDNQSTLLCLLFNAQAGHFLSTEQLAVLQSGRRDTVMQRICRLRAAMDCEAIDSVQGAGYRLTDLGRVECRKAIDAMVGSLSRAAE